MFGKKEVPPGLVEEWRFSESQQNNRLLNREILRLQGQMQERAVEDARIRAYMDYQRSVSYHRVFEQQGKSLEQIVSNFSTTILGDRVLLEMEQQRNAQTVGELRKRIGELETLLVMANEKNASSLSDKR